MNTWLVSYVHSRKWCPLYRENILHLNMTILTNEKVQPIRKLPKMENWVKNFLVTVKATFVLFTHNTIGFHKLFSNIMV